MTQVRMLRTMTGPDGNPCRKGDIVDVDTEIAAHWIDGGVAEAVDAEPGDSTPAPRKSTARSGA